jgi:hypothetical protein
MTDEVEDKNIPTSNSKVAEFFREKITWKNIRYIYCQTREDARIFWYGYIFILVTLFITFIVAFLLKPSITINYLRWYNDSCTIDSTTASPIIECDRSLRLYCSTITEKCACLQNMYWNNSFCDCSQGMYYNGIYCQQRLTFSQSCNPQMNTCMEYLTCSPSTNTCDCSSNSYYNQTTCNPKLPFNATQPYTLAGQCVTGLVCR